MSDGASPLVDALLRNMRSKAREHDTEGALALYDAAPADVRADALALYARGTVYFEAGRLVEAEASYRAARDADPQNADFCVNLAVTWLLEGADGARAAEALAILEPLVARTDERTTALRPTIEHLASVARARLP